MNSPLSIQVLDHERDVADGRELVRSPRVVGLRDPAKLDHVRERGLLGRPDMVEHLAHAHVRGRGGRLASPAAEATAEIGVG